MPIVGDTSEETIEQFVEHINDVLGKTITPRRVRPLFFAGPELAALSFPRRGGTPTAARLDTRFGPMRFLFLQTVGTKPVDGRHQLFTRDYAYKLTMANDKAPVVRWEYVKPRGPGDKRCRHHLQGPIELVMGLKRAYLNDLHLPTGWITFEEVIRFCIVDLGVPHLDSGWNGVLLESYRLFKEEFAPLGTI